MDRLERLTNLVLVLLETGRPLTLTEIADRVGGYPPGGEARRRAFERDKRLLREEGIPLTTVGLNGPEQFGYRIEPEEYYLPDLGLGPEEQLALNLAVAGVHLDDRSGRDALLKLGILARDQPLPTAVLPSSPALPVLDQAVRDRATVHFTYRGEERATDPFGLACRRGWWYLVGFDHDRRAVRRFRVDRFDDLPRVGPAGSFEPPSDLDLGELLPPVPWLLGEGDSIVAEVAVDAVMGPQVVDELGEEAVVRRDPDGSVLCRFEVTNRPAFRSWVLGLLDHAEVLAPAELRGEVVDWLEALA